MGGPIHRKYSSHLTRRKTGGHLAFRVTYDSIKSPRHLVQLTTDIFGTASERQTTARCLVTYTILKPSSPLNTYIPFPCGIGGPRTTGAMSQTWIEPQAIFQKKPYNAWLSGSKDMELIRLNRYPYHHIPVKDIAKTLYCGFKNPVLHQSMLTIPGT